MTHILYINDNNLRLLRLGENRDVTNVTRSKGYAWFKGEQLIFDTDKDSAPIKFCRLAPQEMNNRYWQQCEKSSVNANAAGMRHAADLIWKHLGELKKIGSITDLILVVPSHYQSSNLELLLGIAQSLSINVKAIVNGAVLSLVDELANKEKDGEYLHLDVQLHQTVASNISVKSGVATLGEIAIMQSVGIQAMQDALLKTLQANFIQNDRFDPLHNAETEQQLFDSLADIAEQVNTSSKATVSVNYQNQRYSTSIDLKVWNASLAPFFDELASASAAVKHAFIQINTAFEAQSLSTLLPMKTSFIEDNKLVNIPSIEQAGGVDGSLHYITKMSLPESVRLKKDTADILLRGNERKQKNNQQPTLKVNQERLAGATHLLQSGIAVPIEYAELTMENQQLVLMASAKGNVNTLLDAGKLIILNDESRKNIRPNDRVGSHFADGVVTVIQVV